MQTAYTITHKGMLYAISSELKDMTGNLLLQVLKHSFYAPVNFLQLCEYLNGDKQRAFKQVCEMLESEYIDIDDQALEKLSEQQTLEDITAQSDEFILSDFNGLVVYRSGFDSEDAAHLASMACDLIKVSRRTDIMVGDVDTLQPISIETRWKQNTVITYLLCLGACKCLLTCRSQAFWQQPAVLPMISYLCSRYANG